MSDIPAKDRALGLTSQRVGSKRITKYDQSMALKVLELVAEGKRLKEIFDQPDILSYSTWMKWVSMDPELKKAFDRAKEISAFHLEDKALEQAENLVNQNDYTGTKVRAIEVAMGQWRWSAAKRNPDHFGTKADAGHLIPIQINTTLDLGNGTTPTQPQTQVQDNVYAIRVPLPGDAATDPDEPEPSQEPEDGGRESGAPPTFILPPEKPSGMLDIKPGNSGDTERGKRKRVSERVRTKDPTRQEADAKRRATYAKKRALKLEQEAAERLRKKEQGE